jgi:hypothetical protein
VRSITGATALSIHIQAKLSEFGRFQPFSSVINIALDITQYAKTIKKDEQVMIQAK